MAICRMIIKPGLCENVLQLIERYSVLLVFFQSFWISCKAEGNKGEILLITTSLSSLATVPPSPTKPWFQGQIVLLPRQHPSINPFKGSVLKTGIQESKPSQDGSQSGFNPENISWILRWTRPPYIHPSNLMDLIPLQRKNPQWRLTGWRRSLPVKYPISVSQP